MVYIYNSLFLKCMKLISRSIFICLLTYMNTDRYTVKTVM